jgi:hypothetical protein
MPGVPGSPRVAAASAQRLLALTAWLAIGASVAAPAPAATFADSMDITLDGETVYGVGGSSTNEAWIGYSIAAVGDVDGDGLDDFLIGSSRRYLNPGQAGAAFLVWGFRGPLPNHLPGFVIDTPLVNYFVTIYGATGDDWFGYGVAGGSDVNGDGHPDFGVGAPFGKYFDNTPVGVHYTLFGHARPWPATISVAALTGADGFAGYGSNSSGNAAEESGYSAAFLQHFGDGAYGQVAIGSPIAHVSGDVGVASGRVDFLYGRASFQSYYSLGAYPIGSGGFAIYGGTSQNNNQANLGASVASAGDINGDGYEDLIIGAPGDATLYPYAGSAFVLFGHAGPTLFSLNLGSLNGTNGFHIDPAALTNFLAGSQVGTLGDINADGYSDFFLTVPRTSGCQVFALFGRAGAFPATLDAVAQLDGTHGFQIRSLGAVLEDNTLYCTGISVAGVGDVNGDGIDDFVIGDRAAGGRGVVYVVFGHKGTWVLLEPYAMTHGQGAAITGINIATSGFGTSVAKLGDINGDGVADFAIGVPTNGTAAGHGGTVVLVLGRDGIFDNAFE